MSVRQLMGCGSRFGLFFFFQAEDGIRDHCVTGVQTCALPICEERHHADGDMAVAIRVMALFTVATGVVVMAGALTATRYQRLYESAVLRTLDRKSVV